MRKLRAVTLIELILAIVLLGVITLAVTSIQMFSRYHVITSERRAAIQNEASMALAHMQRRISQAIGDVNHLPWAAYADNRGIRVRIDDNPADGQISANDHWVGYRHENDRIVFYPDDPNGNHSGNSEVIATHVVNSDPTQPDSAANPWGLRFDIPAINRFDITVRTRWDTNTTVAVSPDNPEVVLRNTIVAPGVSTN